MIAARKPLFIDKPLASTLEDAREIARLASAAGVPWFSSSGCCFNELGTKYSYPELSGSRSGVPDRPRNTTSWISPGTHPSSRDPLHADGPRLPGSRTRNSGGDNNSGSESSWAAGKTDASEPSGRSGPREPRRRRLPSEISRPEPARRAVQLTRRWSNRSLTSSRPESLQSPEETLEIFAFMDAAQRSKEAGGKPMRLR